MSIFKKNSHRTGTSDTPICECGFERESSEQFLLRCSRHLQARNQLKDSLNDISDAHLAESVSVRKLVVGSVVGRCYEKER